MENTQTLNFKNNGTLLHNIVLSMGDNIAIKDRFDIGCKPSCCKLNDIVFIYDMLCNDKCYIGEKEVSKIHDFLIKNSDG